MNLNELRDRAYKTACEHGFHDEELSNEHCLCLVLSELMEAVEADRKGRFAKVPVDKKVQYLTNGLFIIKISILRKTLKHISKTVWKTSLPMQLSACLTCADCVRLSWRMAVWMMKCLKNIRTYSLAKHSRSPFSILPEILLTGI